MIYLKTFENQKFYYELNEVDIGYHYSNLDHFSFEESKKMSTFINQYKDYKLYKPVTHYSMEIYFMGFVFINIIKMKDEWYYIQVFDHRGNKYYKCDQWEGLIEFLEDNLFGEAKFTKCNETSKLFENNDYFYQEINISEFDKLLGIGSPYPWMSHTNTPLSISFNEKEKEKIKKIFTRIGPVYFVDKKFPTMEKLKHPFMYIDEFISIYKLKDEWYLIKFWNKSKVKYKYQVQTFNFKYYKCDQWEGLIKCLKDYYPYLFKNLI